MSDTMKSIQSLMQSGDMNAALLAAQRLLDDDAKSVDGLYLAAVACRYLKDVPQAVSYQSRLQNIAPDFGRAFQEEGHLRMLTGEIVRARKSFDIATRLNPALAASWMKLADIAKEQGDLEFSRRAQIQVNYLKSLPHELFAALNHLYEGRIYVAEEIVRAFLRKNTTHIEGMRILSDIAVRLNVTTDAEFLLETALELRPDYDQLRIDYIQVLRKRQKFEESAKQAEILYDKKPDDPLFQSLLAIECLQSGDITRSLELFDAVLTKQPDDLAALTSRGHALKTFNRVDEAVASYREALKANLLHGDAWYALANLKTFRFSDQDIARMQEALVDPDLIHLSRVNTLFALGKAQEDAGNYDAAFEAWREGNALKKHQTRYTSEQMQTEFDLQKTHCTKELFERRKGVGHSAPDPIFILGLPRAGSTLLEQILASHSQVDGTLELPNILSTAHRLRGRNSLSDRERYPRILNELPDEELAKLGETYIETTRIHRKDAPLFTDKMPNNFRHIGLIHLILPNAKIIDARRNPLDCCWSGFKQLFAEGQEFTYGLEEIGHYYRGYVELMDHWNAVLPEGRILKVQHEDVLDDLEGQVRRILDYCGLPFEEACVRFHETERAVRTASSQQVRQPINTSGLEQWRPFESHLGPLKHALGPALTTY